MSDLADRLLLAEMMEAAEKIQSYTAGFDMQAFLNDGLTCDAVALNLLVIGEDASRLSKALCDSAPAVPWGDLIGLRHRIAHGYSKVDLRIVWRIVSSDLQPLVEQLERLRCTLG